MIRYLASPAPPGNFRYLYSSRRCVELVCSCALSSSCPWFSTKSPSFISELWFGGRVFILILDSRRRKKVNGSQDASAAAVTKDLPRSFRIACIICLVLLMLMKNEIQEGSKASFEVPDQRTNNPTRSIVTVSAPLINRPDEVELIYCP